MLFSGGLVAALTDGVFFKATYSEGFRPPDFTATAESHIPLAGITFEPNRHLKVETSRAIETEINAVLLENVRPLRQLYVRADYSYTRMENVIAFPAGRFVNSGDRDIHSVEALTKAAFYGGHELWLSYYFVDVVDSEVGRLRNIANHVLNAGGRLSLFGGKLNLMSVVTVRGSMTDLNRSTDTSYPAPFTPPGTLWVAPTDIEVTTIPTTTLLRVGVDGRDLWGFLDVGAWVYNVLDVRYSDADLFFDDRVTSQPQPREGFSFFAEVGVRW